MAINMTEYIKGLFALEIVDELFILEMKPDEDKDYATEFVVSSTDLFDGETIPPVKDKHFTDTNRCIAFAGLESFESEYLEDTNHELPKDSPYQGYRWRITKANN